VYKTTVVVQENPISRKPFVLLVPEEEKRKGRMKPEVVGDSEHKCSC
jgi:hypothetical protein